MTISSGSRLGPYKVLSPLALSFYEGCIRARNDKLKTVLGVKLRYPSYREGLRALYQAGDHLEAPERQRTADEQAHSRPPTAGPPCGRRGSAERAHGQHRVEQAEAV